MHDFVAHVLHRYYAQTEWNPFNSYLYLTHSSQSVLDFAIPSGLSLSISASPSPPFFTTYRLRALPTLTGALGYIFASVEDNDGVQRALDLGGSTRDIRFKELVDGFRIVDAPRRPTGKDRVWQGGRRVDRRDYLLYGCMHIPSVRVDALMASRLSPTWQLLATAISMPPRNAFGFSSSSASQYASHYAGPAGEKSSSETVGGAVQQPIAAGPPPGTTNLHFNLQNDTGRWFTEYSYSVDDGLLGFRVLHNLGHVDLSDSGSGSGNNAGDGVTGIRPEETELRQQLDEENGPEGTVGGGLQGRFSIGAEVFFSPLEKSAGLSTGMRFTTLPETRLPSVAGAVATSSMDGITAGLMSTRAEGSGVEPANSPSQPPTTITATLNPMMGHLSTAYAARMTRDIVACSRFDFNVYSYESELTLGAEYWLRSNGVAGTNHADTLQREVAAQADGASKEKSDEAAAVVVVAAGSVFPAPSTERQLSARQQGGLSLREGLLTAAAPPSTPPGGPFASQLAPMMSRDHNWTLREQGSVHGDDEDGNVSVEGFPLQQTGMLRPEEPPRAAAAATPDNKPNTHPATQSGSYPMALGVLKARISTSGIASMLWEGKLRNCLVSFGIRGDLSEGMGAGLGGGRPLRGVGIDVIYFSQNGQ